MKTLTLCAILFMLILNGCSMNGFFFEAHNARPLVIIDYPPNRVTYYGDMGNKDMNHMNNVINLLAKEEYINHVHQFPMTLNAKVEEIEIETGEFNIQSQKIIEEI